LKASEKVTQFPSIEDFVIAGVGPGRPAVHFQLGYRRFFVAVIN